MAPVDPGEITTLVLSGAATATAADVQTYGNDPAGIYNTATSQHLVVSSMSMDDGAPAVQRNFPGPWSQPLPTDAQWTLVSTDDGYEIHNVNSGKCLEIADFSTDDGAPAQQWECVGIEGQKWVFTGTVPTTG